MANNTNTTLRLNSLNLNPGDNLGLNFGTYSNTSSGINLYSPQIFSFYKKFNYSFTSSDPPNVQGTALVPITDIVLSKNMVNINPSINDSFGMIPKTIEVTVVTPQGFGIAGPGRRLINFVFNSVTTLSIFENPSIPNQYLLFTDTNYTVFPQTNTLLSAQNVSAYNNNFVQLVGDLGNGTPSNIKVQSGEQTNFFFPENLTNLTLTLKLNFDALFYNTSPFSIANVPIKGFVKIS